MLSYIVPNDVIENVDEINFLYYENETPNIKNKVFFSQNVISFLITGEKEIFFSDKPIKLINKVALINTSYCLMSEKKTHEEKPYQALLIFFDNTIISKFKLKYSAQINSINNLGAKEISVIQNDDFIILYRDYLIHLIQKEKRLLNNLAFKRIKLEELFLYLLENYPKEFVPFLFKNVNSTEAQFKAVVEHNKFANLDIEELAFLCNMSTSTFKRHFKKYYGTSPQKWFFTKRMEYADFQLKSGKTPSQIYLKIGYKNLSNFIRAYKHHFGRTPKSS